MMKASHMIFSALTAFAICGLAEPPEGDCNRAARPYRISARHIEAGGIGYREGYTSLDLFVSRLKGNGLPFVDLRGHVFDNGRFAANAGVGYRYLWNRTIFGGYASYDYKNTHWTHYNQVGAGFEVLMRRWDFRINGYLPVGSKNSDWFKSDYAGFAGHRLLVRRKQEFSMKGLNAEGGVYSDPIRSFWFYGGIGPYYFEGKGENAYGGKIRLSANYGPFLTLEASGSYDNVFHGIVQGQVFVNVPFGPRKKRDVPTGCGPCPDWKALSERFVQPVYRQEIIVTDKRHHNFAAIDPATGLPYYFIFVDNTSSSDGTFESPYPTLAQATTVSNPNDIIYIFTGDGTATGLTTDIGYTLLDNQQLLGSGLSYTFPTTAGPVEVPSLQNGMPYLIDTTHSILISLANNNTIAGLHLETDDPLATCIQMPVPVTDCTLIDNLIEPVGANAVVAVSLSLLSGKLLYQNNTINSTGSDGLAVGTDDSLAAHILGNFFNDSSVQISAGATAGSVCVRFQNNTSSSTYTFDPENSGNVINVEPFTSNTPDTYMTSGSGTVNNVPQGTCQ